MDSWVTSPDVWYSVPGAGATPGLWRKGAVLSAAAAAAAGGDGDCCSFLIQDLGEDGTVSIDTKPCGVEFELVKRRDASLGAPGTASAAAGSPSGHSFLELNDLTNLPHLNEPEVLECLAQRYEGNAMYTATGPILLAINPCRDLPGNYSAELLERYFQEGEEGDSGSVVLPPHIYKTSDHAYRCMFIDRYSPDERENQSILVNGESGAGKTESTKHCLHYLAVVSSKTATNLGLDSESSSIENQIIASNPITESLGNAKTSLNDNSSRFGKFINLHYCADGVIQSATLQTYLLETVRLVSHSKGERSFHIFYEMAAGMSVEELKAAGLLRDDFSSCDYTEDQHDCAVPRCMLQDFLYMSPSSSSSSSSLSLENQEQQRQLDRDNYHFFLEALDALDFSEEQQASLLDILVAVLHLGNVTFVESEAAGEEAALFSPAALRTHVPFICSALSVHPEDLLTALARRSLWVNGSTTVKTLNVRDAISTKDSFARSLYAHLFDSVLCCINERLSGGKGKDGSWSRPLVASSISLLDIFGFEFFETNSFEQLCINYTNEKLQDHFNHSIFRLEQELYQAEGLQWTPVDYPDNSVRLDLLENTKHGIFHLCNERMKLKYAVTNQTLAKDFYSACTHNTCFSASAAQRREFQFVVKHYAGDVVYSTDHFLLKNRSDVAPEFTSCLLSSSSTFVRQLVRDSGGGREQEEENFPTIHLKTPVMRTPHKSASFVSANDRKVGQAVTPATPSFATPSPPPPSRQNSDLAGKRRLYLGSASKGREGGLHTSPMRVSSPLGSATRGSSQQRQRLQLSPKVMALTHVRSRSVTVLSQFSQQLRDLMVTIKSTRSHFIRCIKPNSSLAPAMFNRPLVQAQLRCGGVLEAIEVFRAGFPNRFEFSAFVQKYSGLVYVPGSNALARDFHALRSRAKETTSDAMWSDTCSVLFKIIPLAEMMLTLIESNPHRVGSVQLSTVLAAAATSCGAAHLLRRGMCLGRSRVFLRAEAFEYLERLLYRTRSFMASVFQRNFRLSHMVKALYTSREEGADAAAQQRLLRIGAAVGHFTTRARASIVSFLKAAILLQRRARVFLATLKLKCLRFLCTWTASHFRGYQCRRRLFAHRNAQVTRIQAFMRGRRQYVAFSRQRKAAQQVQKWYRHAMQIRQCKQALRKIYLASAALTRLKAVARGRSVRKEAGSAKWRMSVSGRAALADLEGKSQKMALQQEKQRQIMATLVANMSNSEVFVDLLFENPCFLGLAHVQSAANQEQRQLVAIEKGGAEDGVINPMHSTGTTSTSTAAFGEGEGEASRLRAEVRALQAQVEELQRALKLSRGHSGAGGKRLGCCF